MLLKAEVDVIQDTGNNTEELKQFFGWDAGSWNYQDYEYWNGHTWLPFGAGWWALKFPNGHIAAVTDEEFQNLDLTE